MQYICRDCGSEIPDDSDFCYRCGGLKVKANVFDDTGVFVAHGSKCEFCNSDIGPNDLFCQNCGRRISSDQMMFFKPKMVRNGWIGILLAIIPGIVDIFGLGHLYFRKWSRGVMYLVISCFFVYIQYFSGVTGDTRFLFEICSIFVYFIQAMEVVALSFMPPKPERKV